MRRVQGNRGGASYHQTFLPSSRAFLKELTASNINGKDILIPSERPAALRLRRALPSAPPGQLRPAPSPCPCGVSPALRCSPHLLPPPAPPLPCQTGCTAFGRMRWASQREATPAMAQQLSG